MSLGIEFKVDKKVTGTFLKNPEKAFPIFEKAFRGAMENAVALAQSEIVPRTPSTTGTLRRSITTEIEGRGIQIRGVIGTPSLYAIPMEYGTKPHFPPPGPIELWVRRKNIQWSANNIPMTVRQMAFFIINYQIGRKGLKAWKMFTEGLAASKNRILGFFNAAQDEVIKKLSED